MNMIKIIRKQYVHGGVARELVVEHVVDALDVESPSSNVGRDECARFAGLEAVQVLQPLPLL